jgi:phage tail sheath protein FI
MSYNLGLNLVEVDGKVAPSIQPAATSIAGFSIFAERGVPGRVVKVTNWTQFLEQFGGYTAYANGAYALRGFFDNGGSTAWVTRVVNETETSDAPISVTTSDAPFSLTEGDVLTFSTGESVVFETAGPAMVTGGSTAAGLVGTTFTIAVNQAPPVSYEFVSGDFANPGTPTLLEAVNALNREIGGVRIYINGDGNIEIRTDELGSDGTLTISGTAATIFGVETSGEQAGPGNVIDMAAVTAQELADALDAALPSSYTVTVVGDAVTITHATLIHITGGAGVAASLGLDTSPHDGVSGSGTAAVAAHQTFGGLEVAAGNRGAWDPGRWGNELGVSITNHGDTFTLSVKLDATEVESWANLSMDPNDPRFVREVINDPITGSKYIWIPAATGLITPANATDVPLANGEDGSFVDSATAFAGSFDLFQNRSIQLLLCPESSDATVILAGITHCELMDDRMFIGHVPDEMEAGSVETWAATFHGDKQYGALYFPWIQVADPRTGRRRYVPPTGHVAGVYARTDRERGVWKAPAGVQAAVNGALDVRYHITDTDHTSLVKNGKVNAVRFVPNYGIIVDSSRTLSSNTIWLYVNVRLLFNFVKSSLLGGLRWVVQEPNDESLWNKVKFNTVTPFLLGLWRRGAFGPGSPDEVFTVKIDAENNPPANIQQGLLICEVYFYPSRPAETIVIIVGQQEGGGSASEA